MTHAKGVVLISGGLDSLLAARLLLDQNIPLVGFHGVLPFVSPHLKDEELPAVIAAARLGLETNAYRCGRDYLEMLKNPKHGYGANVNPCIDCHIYLLRKAASYMREIGAEFVATGEVVGQRPMSQMKHMLIHIEKECGLRGRIVRPLSALLLQPTFPELSGTVDRSRLYAVSGRSRKVQFELAQRFGITEYSSPAGGCLFTDGYFSRRIKDLIRHDALNDPVDVYLCTLGRHFRISESAKLIVGRNEKENAELMTFRHHADYWITPSFQGPVMMVQGILSQDDMNLVASIMAFYGRQDSGEKMMRIEDKDKSTREIRLPEPIERSVLELLRI